MSNDNFVHLHLHTQYSLLDGANKINKVIEKASSLNQAAIGITDHGNLHGAIEFYNTAKKNGIKPLIGCELYVTPGSRFDRKTKAHGGAGTFHLTVIAKNYEGYLNLCRLSSLSYKDGFYFKPRVDHEILQMYSEGLIVLSGCLASELSGAIGLDDRNAAKKLLNFYTATFKDNFFLEVQPHNISEQRKHNKGCLDLAKELGIPLVATTDCHYTDKDDHYAQEVLMCISTGKLITDPERIKHEGVELYLKSESEMYDSFLSFPKAEEAIKNTKFIADQCDLQFDFSKYHMPKYSDGSEVEHVKVMAEIAREGLQKRIEQAEIFSNSWSHEKKSKYTQRLEEELTLIEKMGFASYFLVVSDFIVWAKEHQVPVGPGRGSVAGSLVAYAMRITDVDPITHKLLFERFLNPERISLPDIDVDFCIYGRDKVIQYVIEKYGQEKVAQIATFGTLKAKAAIKDVGRALGLSYAETDRIAQLIPAPRQGFDYPIAEALKMEPRLEEYARNDGKELITLALKLEGLTRHTSTHAAGVVIGDRPLMELLPMMVDKDGNDVTQYSMSYVEKIGLVKFDFLGLKTLTVLDTAKRIIEESSGIHIDLASLNLEDSKSYSLLSKGATTGVFQLESSGITEMTMRLKPSCFDDLVAILALYRPGPLDAGMVDHYIERKHKREEVTYLHPAMKDVLSDTYGIMIYQEQIMQLARVLSGYSLGEADLLRRAMGKKNPEEMAKQRIRFIEGALKNKIQKNLAEEIFDQMETFARYGFNKSHSVAYAMISFQTAYLKAHYPVEFMAALMSHEMDDSDKVLKNLTECRKQHIKVLPPDVNKSVSGFSVQEGKIRYGLEAIKGIGEKAVMNVQATRKQHGDFEGFEDFISKTDLKAMNKRVLESLIKCGAFDFSRFSRRELFERIEEVLKEAQSLQKEVESKQLSLFAPKKKGKKGVLGVQKRTTNRAEWSSNEKLRYEYEALGFFISGHPLEKHKNLLEKIGAVVASSFKKSVPQSRVKAAGIVTALKLKNTKKGDRYASFVLEDYTGTIETLVWPDVYKNVFQLLESTEPVLISGKADITEERSVLIAETVMLLEETAQKSASTGILKLSKEDIRVLGSFEKGIAESIAVFSPVSFQPGEKNDTEQSRSKNDKYESKTVSDTSVSQDTHLAESPTSSNRISNIQKSSSPRRTDVPQQSQFAFKTILKKYPGSCTLQVTSDVIPGYKILLKDEHGNPVKVSASNDLCMEIEQFFGRQVLTFM
jgi:DNA polymerase III subunit alpha